MPVVRSNRAATVVFLALWTAPSRAFTAVPATPVVGLCGHGNVAHKPCHHAAIPSLRMVSYEDLQEKLPSKAVIDVVSMKPEKVVASDVATAAGISLSQARKDLTALASISRGDISVDKDGELIYSFPRDLNSVLASNSVKYQTLQLARKVWPAVFWGVRVSFGVTLLVSLVAVFTTIFFITSSSSNNDDRRRDDRGGGMSFGMGGMWGPSPLDFFFYRPYGSYGYYGQPERDPEEMGFFESVFSYIFGDGDPNAGLEEKRLGLVASMIRENKGAVTAEQLAPYCDGAPNPQELASKTYVDESFVLPIVTALNGEPRVTEDGSIVYTFPELQMSTATVKVIPAASKEGMILRRAGLRPEASTADIKQLLNYNGIGTRGARDRRDLVKLVEEVMPPMTEEEEMEMMGQNPALLQEREWKFSLAPEINRFLAGGLGVVNLGGALYLGNLLGQYAMYGVRLPSYFGIVQGAYPFLLAYAILFNVIPLGRNFLINQQNNQIRQRNLIRRKWRTALESSLQSGEIGRKIAAARKMGTDLKKLGAAEDVVFDTRKPMEEIQRNRENSALDDFDRKLRESEGKSFE
jgi:hypothetical protein